MASRASLGKSLLLFIVSASLLSATRAFLDSASLESDLVDPRTDDQTSLFASDTTKGGESPFLSSPFDGSETTSDQGTFKSLPGWPIEKENYIGTGAQAVMLAEADRALATGQIGPDQRTQYIADMRTLYISEIELQNNEPSERSNEAGEMRTYE